MKATSFLYFIITYIFTCHPPALAREQLETALALCQRCAKTCRRGRDPWCAACRMKRLLGWDGSHKIFDRQKIDGNLLLEHIEQGNKTFPCWSFIENGMAHLMLFSPPSLSFPPLYSPCAPAEARRWIFFDFSQGNLENWVGNLEGIFRGFFLTHRTKAQNFGEKFRSIFRKKIRGSKKIFRAKFTLQTCHLNSLSLTRMAPLWRFFPLFWSHFSSYLANLMTNNIRQQCPN